jgi:ATP-dependent Clp protease ATP-binding subunit ClpB
MTSNMGSPQIQELTQAGKGDRIRAAVMEVVQQELRPEFLNRIDELVIFQPLGREQIRAIADIQLGDLRARLRERGFQLALSEGALDKLASVGFDPVFGARPLKRAIQAEVENPLAQSLLKGEFVPGDTIVAELGANGGIGFAKQATRTH